MRRTIVIGCLALLVSADLAFAAPEPAQDRALAKAFRRGTHLVRTRQYREALEAFQEALALDPSSVDVYFNLASIARELKQWGFVHLYGRAYLYLDRKSRDAKEIRGWVEHAEKQLVDVGRMTIYTEPEGAEVFLDDAIQGKAPLFDLPVLPGPHRLRAAHPTCEPTEQKFPVEAGEHLELTMLLSPKLFYGHFTVKTVPAEGVSVYIDDELKGTTPLGKPIRLQTKEYLVRFELEGWDQWVRYVTIERDKTMTLEARLERTGAAPIRPKEDKGPPKPPMLRQ